MSARDKWNRIYQQRAAAAPAAQPEPSPCTLLSDYHYLLPSQGRALDLACGLGGNAIFLQKQGFIVDAWDISDVAINHLAALQLPNLTPQQVDTEKQDFPQQQYDVIVVAHYLDRPLCSRIVEALAPQGLLFYQTFHQDKVDSKGPSNPDYLLENNELLSLFSTLSPLIHSHLGHQGDIRYGERNLASLIAQKPA